MQKDDYVNLLRKLKAKDKHQLSSKILNIASRFRDEGGDKLPTIWLETNDSGDNSISFMNTTYPYFDQVFENIIKLYYSNTFMTAQGKDAYQILYSAALENKGEFTLVVEGAIPLKADGRYNIIFITEKGPVTALEAVKLLGGM